MKIYIGDFKLNPEIHHFITKFNKESIPFIEIEKRIPVFDCDWLGLSKPDIQWLAINAPPSSIITTLNDELIDSKCGVEVIYIKTGMNEKTGIFDIFRYINNSDNPTSTYNFLKETNISTHVLLKWYIGSVNQESFTDIAVLDQYVNKTSPEIWLSILSLTIPNKIRKMSWMFGK